MRCLVTDILAVFLDTMTAYPSAFLGRMAVKFIEESLFPLFKDGANSERFSRFCFGNTGFMRKAVFYLFFAVSVLFCAQSLSFSLRGIRAFLLFCVFWADMFVLTCEMKCLGYTQDTNRFSTKCHTCFNSIVGVYSETSWINGVRKSCGNMF
jgi:hypothetical protein